MEKGERRSCGGAEEEEEQRRIDEAIAESERLRELKVQKTSVRTRIENARGGRGGGSGAIQ